MKNTKKLFLSLSAMVCVLGLAACGGTSTALPPSTSGNTSTPSTSTPAPAENTFGEGITDDEKTFFPGLISGTGDFTKNTNFTATGSLTDRFDVKVGGTLKYIIYKGAKANGFGINITAYIGVDVSTLKISGFKTVGDVHSNDTNADISSLPLVGTDGNIIVENGSMSGATVSANTLVDIAKEAVAQVKVDAGSSTAENTFGDGITAEEKEIFPSLIKGTGDFTKNTDFTATGSLTDRFDVKVSDTLKYIIYKGSKANGFGVNITAYIGVDVSTFQISGFKTVGDVHSEGSNFDISSLPLAGTDGNITVESGSMGGATVSANTLVAIAKEAVAQAKVDTEEPTEETDDVEVLTSLAGTGTYTKDTSFTATDILTSRYVVTENGFVTKVIYKGHKLNSDRFKVDVTAYIAVDALTLKITGFETVGTLHSANPDADVSALPLPGTDGNITVNDGDFGGGKNGATVSAKAVVEIAKAAVAQANIDFPPLTSEETTALSTLISGEYTRHILANVTYDSTYIENGKILVTDCFYANEGNVVVYRTTMDKGWGTYLTTFVGVDVDTLKVTGVELTGTRWSPNWTPVDVENPDQALDDFADKFVNTDGNITDTITGLTQSTSVYKELVQAAVKQAKVDFPVLTTEESAALETLAGSGTIMRQVGFTSDNELVARYDVTEGDAVTKVIYKGEVSLPQGYTFTAYVAVDVNTHLITGYELLGEPVSSRWEEKGYASQFEGWEDKFVGTDGSTDLENVVQATLTSNAFKNIAKAAVAQAVIDFE